MLFKHHYHIKTKYKFRMNPTFASEKELKNIFYQDILITSQTKINGIKSN